MDFCAPAMIFLIALVVVAFVGHLLWLLGAEIAKNVFSAAPPRGREPRFHSEHDCPRCGERLRSFEQNCPACGLEREGDTARALRNLDITADAIEELVREGKTPTPAFNNCSGKHSGFLTTAVQYGEPTKDYIKYNHPVQRRLREIEAAVKKVEAAFGKKTVADLPVDQHELIALCAPRLCLISYGVPAAGDPNWVDARGSFMAAVLAGPSPAGPSPRTAAARATPVAAPVAVRLSALGGVWKVVRPAN